MTESEFELFNYEFEIALAVAACNYSIEFSQKKQFLLFLQFQVHAKALRLTAQL
jgi:hypothetical protein